MREMVNKLMKIAKKEIAKSVYHKIMTISDIQDLQRALKYSLINSLENKIYLLENKIRYLKQYNKDVFFAETKLIYLKSKLHHFKVSFNEKEYEKLEEITKDIQTEIANV